MPGFEFIDKEEFLEVKEVFDKSNILFRHSFDNLRNNIYKVRDFEEKFRLKVQSKYSLAVSSGTAALRVALASLNLKDGDEVITQSFTFVATVEAIIESRCKPIIADIDYTLNMSSESLIKKITKKTKAIIVVHMLGVPTNMNKIMKIAKKYKLHVIEDTAWGCGGKLGNKYLGTIGDIGTYSFDFAKTMTTGEGGMIVYKDKKKFNKGCAWHDHGHENNPKLPRWEDSRTGSGFNFRMMELQGAVGIAQLKKLDKIIKMQRSNENRIRKQLSKLKLFFREVPKNSYQTCDALIFFVENKIIAKKCRNALVANSINTKILPEAYTWHFAGTWSHMKELKLNKKNNNFPISQKILERAVSIPIICKMPNHVPSQIYKALKPIIGKK